MIIVIAEKTTSNLQSIIELLAKVKRELKKNTIAEEICREHNFGIDIIDGISFEFEDDLEASAKTINSKILLNSNLMDEEFEIIMRYAIHELVHALQHMRGEGGEKDEAGSYLDREDELEAFQYQIEYELEERGEESAEEYVDNLIEYHEVPPEERENKKEELLERTE